MLINALTLIALICSVQSVELIQKKKKFVKKTHLRIFF